MRLFRHCTPAAGGRLPGLGPISWGRPGWEAGGVGSGSAARVGPGAGGGPAWGAGAEGLEMGAAGRCPSGGGRGGEGAAERLPGEQAKDEHGDAGDDDRSGVHRSFLSVGPGGGRGTRTWGRNVSSERMHGRTGVPVASTPWPLVRSAGGRWGRGCLMVGALGGEPTPPGRVEGKVQGEAAAAADEGGGGVDAFRGNEVECAEDVAGAPEIGRRRGGGRAARASCFRRRRPADRWW